MTRPGGWLIADGSRIEVAGPRVCPAGARDSSVNGEPDGTSVAPVAEAF
jgi:hypothetical protein